MKRSLLFIIATAFLLSCNGDIKVNDSKLDKLDEAGKDLQKSVKKGVDTVASKVKKLKRNLEEDHRSSTAR